MTQSIRDAAQALLNAVHELLDDPERMEYTLSYKVLEDLRDALVAPQPTADERIAAHMRMVEEYVEDSIGFATMPGHASMETAERAEDRCFNKRGEIMQSARALLSASQYDAEAQSRAMFVARLENMSLSGDTWLTIPSVLALINDCDMLANRAAIKEKK